MIRVVQSVFILAVQTSEGTVCAGYSRKVTGENAGWPGYVHNSGVCPDKGVAFT